MNSSTKLVLVAGILLAVVSLSFIPATAQSYTVTDLGTLGGKTGGAAAISENGLIAGSSQNIAGTQHAFFCSPGSPLVDIGLLHANDGFSVATGVNNSGSVVGISGLFAFIWTQAGGIQDLGNLGGSGGATLAYGINNAGQVVGSSPLAGDLMADAYLWTSASGMQDLGTLGGIGSTAMAINDSGQVAGYSVLADNVTLHAFFWTANGGMQDLGTLGGSSSVATGINALGQVTGWSLTPSGAEVAFLWDSSHGMRSLGTINSAVMVGTGINKALQVVGFWQSGPHQTSFLWTRKQGLQNLSGLIVPKGSTIREASAINDVGQIAGTYGHAILLTPTK